jgi:transcriptional regulator with XRE-family HTH domain
VHIAIVTMHTYVVNPQSATTIDLVNAPGVTLIERIEQARESIGWTGRELAREAGLKHESHYSVVLKNLKMGGGAKAETIDKIVQCLVGHGFAEEWIRYERGSQRRSFAQQYEPAKRGLSPTPAPLSTMRSSNHHHLVVPTLPNRDRAAALLVARGYESADVDEALALIAFDARLAPCEDRPVSWWLDAMRDRVSRA